jgi:hypothetical protein
MTDRYNYIVVGLEKDLREDDSQALIRAISLFRGVLSVEPHVADADAWIAEERARRAMHDKLFKVLYPEVA